MTFLMKGTAASAFCLTFALAGCGGGGDGGGNSGATQQPAAAGPQITKDNYQTIAAHAYSATNALGQSALLVGQIVSGVSVQTGDIGLADASLNLLYRALQNPAGNLAMGVEQTNTAQCTGGGSVTATVSYSDPQGRLRAGDRVTVTANQCVESGAMINGGATVTVNSLNGQPGANATWSGALGVQYRNLSVTSGSDSVVANGDLTISLNQTASKRSLDLTNTNLSLALNRSGTLRSSRTVQGLRGNWTQEGTKLTSRADYGLSGNAATIGNFSGTIGTQTSFVAASGENPSTGSATFTGVDGGTVTLKAVDKNSVNLVYSAKGDGNVTHQVTITWAALAASI